MHGIDLKVQIYKKTDELMNNIEHCQWSIKHSNLKKVGQSIEMFQSQQAALSEICSKINASTYRAYLQCHLAQLKKEIEFSKRVVEFLRSGDRGIDPRLIVLLNKVTDPSRCFSPITIENYCHRVNILANSGPNELTGLLIPFAHQQLSKRWIAQFTPQYTHPFPFANVQNRDFPPETEIQPNLGRTMSYPQLAIDMPTLHLDFAFFSDKIQSSQPSSI